MNQVEVRPPKLAEWLLLRFLLRGEREEKLGDLLEVFLFLSSEEENRKARFWYWK